MIKIIVEGLPQLPGKRSETNAMKNGLTHIPRKVADNQSTRA